MFLATLALHLLSSGEVSPPAAGTATQTQPLDSIPISKNELWRESERVSLQQTMYCGKFVAEFDAELSADGVKVSRIKLNASELPAAVRSQAEQLIREMGGFDYAYLVCTDTHARLAFDRRARDYKVERRSIDLT
jgi:hypothetical protein